MEIQKSINNVMDKIFQNPYIMAVVKVSLILYASQLAPRLNSYNLFNNIFVKIFAIALLIYSAERRDFQMAILVALVYVLSINVASGRGLLETFAEVTNNASAPSGATLLEPKLHVYPGCQNITLQQLVDAFEGDQAKLRQMVITAYSELIDRLKESETKQKILRLARSMGLPYNYELKEEHAPYIATLLVYFGFTVNSDCSPPQ